MDDRVRVAEDDELRGLVSMEDGKRVSSSLETASTDSGGTGKRKRSSKRTMCRKGCNNPCKNLLAKENLMRFVAAHLVLMTLLVVGSFVFFYSVYKVTSAVDAGQLQGTMNNVAAMAADPVTHVLGSDAKAQLVATVTETRSNANETFTRVQTLIEEVRENGLTVGTKK